MILRILMLSYHYEYINFMKKVFTLIFATMALSLALISCNKDKDKEDLPTGHSGQGGWYLGGADYVIHPETCYAWYYYNADNDGYQVIFSEEDDFENFTDNNYAYIQLGKSLCGTSRFLTDNLNTDDWEFNVGAKGERFGNDDLEGTVFLSIDEAHNKIVCKVFGLDGTSSGIKIEYEGYAQRVDHYTMILIK